MRPNQERMMKAVILYDDFNVAVRAKSMLEHASKRAGERVFWNVNPWHLDMLRLPRMEDSALEDASDAHLIVLAIHRVPPSQAWLWSWIRLWAESRVFEEAAIAVWQGKSGGKIPPKTAQRLRKFAERHAVSLVFDAVASSTKPARTRATAPRRRKKHSAHAAKSV
jgi:hypothetical protein